MSVAFVREESAEAAQEVTLPARPISTHPNLVTQSGLRALEQAVANSRAATKAAQLIDDANERRRAGELAARDVRYFSERLASAELRPEPTSVEVVAFGHRVTIVRDDKRLRRTGSSARTRLIRALARYPMFRRSRVARSANASAIWSTWTATR
jgi:hypothetical protein